MKTQTDRRAVLAAILGLPLAACETIDPAVIDGILGGPAGNITLSQSEAAAGIRAALEKGVTTAVQTVGRLGGFYEDDKIRIPLPNTLEDIQSALRPFGFSGLVDEIEVALNRGAERAAPPARDLFVDVIMDTSIADALGLVRGGQTAATDYLKAQTLPRLVQMFTPVISSALQDTGAYRLVDQLSEQLSGVPFAPQLTADAKNDLTERGVTGGLNGLFYYIAEQEAAIRNNPAERTSEILRRVFGG